MGTIFGALTTFEDDEETTEAAMYAARALLKTSRLLKNSFADAEGLGVEGKRGILTHPRRNVLFRSDFPISSRKRDVNWAEVIQNQLPSIS